MVHLLSSERSSLAAASFRFVLTLINWRAKIRARRANLEALKALLEYDETRLDDLGINRQDLLEVLDDPSGRAGFRLTHRRLERTRKRLDQYRADW